jgi:hypothetical protein
MLERGGRGCVAPVLHPILPRKIVTVFPSQETGKQLQLEVVILKAASKTRRSRAGKLLQQWTHYPDWVENRVQEVEPASRICNQREQVACRYPSRNYFRLSIP